MTCLKPDAFLLAATLAATFAATLLPFVLRAQVLYHVLFKMAESENEVNIMYLLLLACALFELCRKKSNLICDYSISQDGMIFLLVVKALVAEAVIPEYLPVNQAVERRVCRAILVCVGPCKGVSGCVGLCRAM